MSILSFIAFKEPPSSAPALAAAAREGHLLSNVLLRRPLIGLATQAAPITKAQLIVSRFLILKSPYVFMICGVDWFFQTRKGKVISK
jgi:hypothetical protein